MRQLQNNTSTNPSTVNNPPHPDPLKPPPAKIKPFSPDLSARLFEHYQCTPHYATGNKNRRALPPGGPEKILNKKGAPENASASTKNQGLNSSKLASLLQTTPAFLINRAKKEVRNAKVSTGNRIHQDSSAIVRGLGGHG